MSRPSKKGSGRKTVDRPEDVPAFASEEEEARFWSEHELGAAMLERMEPIGEDVLPPPRSRPVSVRFDEGVLARLKALAERRGSGYQTLLKQFVVERLYEEEHRDGILRSSKRSAGFAIDGVGEGPGDSVADLEDER